MKEENKYYTPEIEDLHVGYEVESYEWSRDEAGVEALNYDRWVSTKLDERRIETILKYKNLSGIRVPYLTKEQIEAEGWEIEEGHTGQFYRKKGEFEIYRMSHYNTKTGDEELELKLLIYTIQNEQSVFLYKGDYKSINEFRTLMKWLNIK